MTKKKIVFTGGGTAGHVTVNLALIPKFLKEGWEISYIGSENGIEKQLITEETEIPYYGISTGKLRRYLDIQNIKDPFKVIKGAFQSYRLLKKLKPDILFSKGGFVSVPVVFGAWLNKIPVVIHESDLTPGLANRLAIPFATKVCTTFPDTGDHLKSDKILHIGAVVREELKLGNAYRGITSVDFVKEKPVLLVMGGSLGARRINEAIRSSLNELLTRFQIIHICGKGNVDPSIRSRGYKQFEYVKKELSDFMSMADVVVSRAGSNSIFEFLALRKPMLLVPLSRQQSRGDQILNANSFEQQGFCEVLHDEDVTGETLTEAVIKLHENKEKYITNMEKRGNEDQLGSLLQTIKQTAK